MAWLTRKRAGAQQMRGSCGTHGCLPPKVLASAAPRPSPPAAPFPTSRALPPRGLTEPAAPDPPPAALTSPARFPHLLTASPAPGTLSLELTAAPPPMGCLSCPGLAVKLVFVWIYIFTPPSSCFLWPTEGHFC